MSFLLVFFFVFGAASSLFILIYASTSPGKYFSAAFPNERPKITGPTAAATDEVVCYWVTKIFLVCLIGIAAIYLLT
jgi:hypothetical protein